MSSDRSRASSPLSFFRRSSSEAKKTSKSSKPTNNSKGDRGIRSSSDLVVIKAESGTSTRKPSAGSKGLPRIEPPSAGVYAFEAGRQTIEILQNFSNLLPIPCANVVLEVALSLMTTYEDVTLVGEQVKELNNRIGCLMLVMVDGISGKDEALISPAVVRDIESLGESLQVIQKDLNRIAAQRTWLLVFFRSTNKDTVDACLDRLTDALQCFQVARSINDGNMLLEIQTRLDSISKETGKMAKKVDQIYDWLVDKDAHNAQSSLVLEEMPVLTRLYGRDGVVEQIAQLLTTKSRPRVGVLGAGGMGKTSVAVAVMENEIVGKMYKESHRFWVPCVGVTSPTVFLQIISKSLRVNQDTGAPLKDIIHALKSTTEPRLLLIDNMESAMSLPEVMTDGGRLSAEAIINQLASVPHVSMLVTIRSNTLPSDVIAWDLIRLEGVAREDARSIFTSICPSAADDPALDALLEALGYMPYAVTLLAKQAVKSYFSPGQLLEEWKKSGTEALSGDLKLKMNRSIEFSVESKAMVENPNAQLLLAILSQLPAGTNYAHLTWWARSVEHVSGAISTLSDTALIAQRQEGVSSPTLSVLPVVQSYLHEQSLYNSPKVRRLVIEACCRFVLDHKSSPGDEHFKAHLKELDIEKTNIQTILLSVTPQSLLELEREQTFSNVFDAMLAFGRYQVWTRASLEFSNHLLDLASSSSSRGEDALRRIAEARFCLGETYYWLGRYNDSCGSYEIARSEFRELGTPADLVRAGEAALCIFRAWMLLDKSADELEQLMETAQDDFNGNPKGIARVLICRGYTYWYSHNSRLGLETLKSAKQSLETLQCTAEVAQCMLYMMRCYANLGLLSDWMKVGKETLQLAKSIGIGDTIWEALDGISRCHVRMQQYDDAITTIKETLAVAEQVGEPLSIAQTVELTGYAYGSKGDVYGAGLAYRRAKAMYSELEETSTTTSGVDRCTYNLQQIQDVGEGGLSLWAPDLD